MPVIPVMKEPNEEVQLPLQFPSPDYLDDQTVLWNRKGMKMFWQMRMAMSSCTVITAPMPCVIKHKMHHPTSVFICYFMKVIVIKAIAICMLVCCSNSCKTCQDVWSLFFFPEYGMIFDA